MGVHSDAESLESQIDQWRDYVRDRKTIDSADVEELEDHLRARIDELLAAGLSVDEAFVVAVMRMGNLDEVSKEFARAHSDRLWKQLALVGDSPDEDHRAKRRDFLRMGLYATAAAVAIKIPAAFGLDLYEDSFYGTILGLLVLPLLGAYLAAKRRLTLSRLIAVALPFVVSAILVGIYPFESRGSTELLWSLHLPLALWLAIGLIYVEGDWRQVEKRMNFVRFSGEWFIYFSLISLGGGVLVGLTAATFSVLGFEPDHFIQYWMIPCGAAGAVVVAAWLVEAKQSVIENMAPVLTKVFTPLFAVMLLASVVALLVGAGGLNIDRDSLILFDGLLIAVVALLLYAISARPSEAGPTALDRVQLVLVLSALVLDVVAMVAILSRISEFGFTPNRSMALGWNLILLANLIWSAWLFVGLLRGRKPLAALEKWQTSFLTVYGAWAAVVVVVFPVLFDFL
jgi:hypothetical protein